MISRRSQTSGFRAETLSSLERCSNFKRTNQFILQAWEALYRHTIKVFLTNENSSRLQIEEVVKTHAEKDCPGSMTDFLPANDDFQKFCDTMSERDETWQFWNNFLFHDGLAYLGLYFAIRSGNWTLRLASLKGMAPLFAAYDRTCYQKLIPQHLADIQLYPQAILDCLKAGGFAASITGHRFHSVALDEAHEMCINKDLKQAVVRPTVEYLQKTSLFYRFRVKAYKNIMTQLFPSSGLQTDKSTKSMFINCPETRARQENVSRMMDEIEQKQLLPILTTNRGLINTFTGQRANHAQTHDLLNFRDIGTTKFENYVSFRILKAPSTSEAPQRKQRLLTMAPAKVTRRTVSQKEKEHKQVTKCLRRRLAWCTRTGEKYDPANEQYSPYPRALSDTNGQPHSGVKKFWTDRLQKRYSKLITADLPEWIPEAVILEGMFLINTSPMKRMKSISEYSLLLLNRFVLPHFRRGGQEVHLIFDNPGSLPFSPKFSEHQRRDSKSIANVNHKHITFTPETALPRVWRDYIECRQCKRSIVEAIGLALLRSARSRLFSGQKLILAGCFSGPVEHTAWAITSNEIPQPLPELSTNAEEADMRIWRHALLSNTQNILVHSPDTDVYNIGLRLMPDISKQVVVQLNLPHVEDLKYLHLNYLIECFNTDPDLATLPQESLPHIMQMLFISTGCDFISYFSGFGKASVLNIFYQYAQFITSGDPVSGTLSDTDDPRKGFLAFMRLVGTLYFKKHLSAFISRGYETPQHLFHSLEEASPLDQHQQWLENIRGTIGERITSEDERVPSHGALWRHWLRSCWVYKMWGKSMSKTIGLPPPEKYGWELNHNDGTYCIDWECEEVQQQIKNSIDFLCRGCGCKKGCKTKSCGCRRKGKPCGPGCECQQCTNLVGERTDKQDSILQTEQLAVQENEWLHVDHESDEDTDLSDSEAIAESEVITDNFFVLELDDSYM